MSRNNTFTVACRISEEDGSLGLKVVTDEGDPVCEAANEQAAQIIVEALNERMLRLRRAEADQEEREHNGGYTIAEEEAASRGPDDAFAPFDVGRSSVDPETLADLRAASGQEDGWRDPATGIRYDNLRAVDLSRFNCAERFPDRLYVAGGTMINVTPASSDCYGVGTDEFPVVRP